MTLKFFRVKVGRGRRYGVYVRRRGMYGNLAMAALTFYRRRGATGVDFEAKMFRGAA